MTLKDMLVTFLRNYLSETGAEDYFPSLSDADWHESVPNKCVQDFKTYLLMHAAGLEFADALRKVLASGDVGVEGSPGRCGLVRE